MHSNFQGVRGSQGYPGEPGLPGSPGLPVGFIKVMNLASVYFFELWKESSEFMTCDINKSHFFRCVKKSSWNWELHDLKK